MGDGTEHRTGAEHPDTAQHDLLPAELVAQHAPGQHERGEGQGVAVHHPLEGRDSGVQAALHVGQGHADHGVVQEGQEQDRTQGGQGDGLGRGSETLAPHFHARYSAFGRCPC